MKRVPPLLLCLIGLMTVLASRAFAASPNACLSAAIYDYDLQSYRSEQQLAIVQLRFNEVPISGEMPGVIVEGRTMAPLRLLAEKLGAEVEWIPDEAQVRIVRGDDVILLTLGSATASINGEDREMPDGVPAAMISYQGQGYTMVPLRFFSEALGCKVGWDQGQYIASIFENAYIAPLLADLDVPVHPEKYLIVLDAGHGGSAPGAYYENTAEKDLNLAMIRKLDTVLRGLGYNTLLTRQEDVYMELLDRAQVANDAHGDIFVSIHCNAAAKSTTFQGLYVYHHPDSAEGRVLAQAIQTPACTFTGAVDRGINSANFAVVRETEMPAVLVETGFMSCHEELEKLKNEDYQTRMARGIAQGIVQYLNAKN